MSQPLCLYVYNRNDDDPIVSVFQRWGGWSTLGALETVKRLLKSYEETFSGRNAAELTPEEVCECTQKTLCDDSIVGIRPEDHRAFINVADLVAEIHLDDFTADVDSLFMFEGTKNDINDVFGLVEFDGLDNSAKDIEFLISKLEANPDVRLLRFDDSILSVI